MQTGGIIKTFHGHTDFIHSVSISSNCTRIASGSRDQTIHLWDIQTGECYCVIKQHNAVIHVKFSPIDPQCFMSVSGNQVQQWDIDGHQVGPTYDGSHIAFSLDGTQFALCQGMAVVIQDTSSGAIMAKFLGSDDDFEHCCFSPSGKPVAVVAGYTVYVWDITNSDPHLIGTLVGHTSYITSLTFTPSLISTSHDQSVRFRQICTSSAYPAPVESKSTSAPIKSITLQVQDGIAISSDLGGMVKTWDILTGSCKASFQTPAQGLRQGDAQLVNGRLTFAWWTDDKIHIWDVEKGELLQTVNAPGYNIKGVRMSGDGSKVFCLDRTSVQAWSILTGEVVGEVGFGGLTPGDTLTIDGSGVWVSFPGLNPQGWDFGIPGSPPVPLPNIPLSRPHLGIKQWTTGPSRIKDLVTGKELLQLPGRYVKPTDAWWDGQYLVAGYESGDVLILDFNYMLPK